LKIVIKRSEENTKDNLENNEDDTLVTMPHGYTPLHNLKNKENVES